jgi:hypothetical protein
MRFAALGWRLVSKPADPGPLARAQAVRRSAGTPLSAALRATPLTRCECARRFSRA